jgi:hypothetical protein
MLIEGGNGWLVTPEGGLEELPVIGWEVDDADRYSNPQFPVTQNGVIKRGWLRMEGASWTEPIGQRHAPSGTIEWEGKYLRYYWKDVPRSN